MSARFEIRDRVSIVWVTGSVKGSNAGNLQDVLMSAIDGSPSGSRVVVDMREVRTLSVTGAQALVHAKNAATCREMSFSTNVVMSSGVHDTLLSADAVSAVHTILVPPRTAIGGLGAH